MIVIKDRVKQLATATVATGDLSFSSTPNGYKAFSSVLTSGDQTYYCIENGSAFEIGIGTYGANGANTLSRDTILNSSTGSRLSISGRSTVFITVPASKFPFVTESGELNLALTTLSDVGLTAPASGESLVYNGSSWANTVITGYTTEEAQDAVGGILTDSSSISFSYNDGTPSISASVKNSGITDVMISGGIDAAKIGSGSVSSAEFGYLDGVTAALQGQLDSKYSNSNPSGYLTSSVASATYQPLDADLTSLAAASGSGIYQRSASDTWSVVAIGSGLSLGGGTLSNTLDLSTYLTTSVATSTYLPLAGGTLTGDLLFTDATYDIGKSGATRPRDGFFSRGLGVGNGVNGVYFWAAGTNTRDMYISNAINGSEPQCVIHRVDGISIGSANGAGAINYYNDSAVVGTLWGTTRFDSANIYHQRNGTNAQTFRLAETWTSTTSFGALQIKANAGAAYQIGSAIGSAGGTNRAIEIGHYSSGGTFTSALSVATNGYIGIGSTTPEFNCPLHVRSPSGTTARFTSTDWTPIIDLGGNYGGDTWVLGRIKAAYDGLGSWGGNFSIFTNSSNPTSLVERLTILGTTGRMGVNQSAPTAQLHITQSVNTSGSPTTFLVVDAAHTTMTASTEAASVNFDLSSTKQFATGALTTQRAMRIQAPTYSFVGASTITTASTLSISGPPVAGTNATITKALALHVESGTSSLIGNVGIGTSTPGSVLQVYGSVMLASGDANSWSRGTRVTYVSSDYGKIAFADNGGLEYGPIEIGFGLRTPNVVVRNDTTATQLDIHETFTSTTSFGTFRVKANTGNSYQIGSAIGSAGGTNREIQLGHWNAAGTFSPALHVGTTGRIGIGTSPANYRWLDISASEATGNGVNAFITNTSTDQYSAATLGFRTGASGVGGTISGFASNFTNYGLTNGLNFRGATATDNIAFATGSLLLAGSGTAARFFIASGGNIGVNTQSPASLVDIVQLVSTTGSPTAFTLTGAAHTTLAASTEATDVNFNLSRTVQFATGALTTQRAMRIQAPTYSFVGASTITTASTLSISGAPAAGTNATITNAYALNVESGTSFFGGNVWASKSSDNTTIVIESASNTIGFRPLISLYRRRGTVASPLVVQSGDLIGGLAFTGYDGTSGQTIAQVEAYVDGGVSSGVIPMRISFSTGTTEANRSEKMTIKSTGDVGIGTTTPLSKLDVAGNIAIRNGTTSQAFLLYKTYTSITSYERLNFVGAGVGANFEIGPENGSAGGTLRGLTIGGYSAGSSTITPWLTFTSAGAATFASTLYATGNITSEGLLSSDRYGVSANYRFRRANGTSASPSQVTSGQAVGALSSFGYHDSAAFHTSAGALIYFIAAENFTSTAHGTNIQFWTTPTTSTTSAKRVCIEASGEVTLEAGSHLQTSGAGFKIGTATSQKIGFWNATPVVQQTTASTSATVVGGGGTTVTQTDTFDGYTLAQIVKALRTIGILA